MFEVAGRVWVHDSGLICVILALFSHGEVLWASVGDQSDQN